MDRAQLDTLLLTDPLAQLPDYPHEQRNRSDVPRAPVRAVPLDAHGKRLAVRNVLRYVPSQWHARLATEFADELTRYGHIYAFRFMPNFVLKAVPIDQIRCGTRQAAAIVLMVLNNLDPAVAQFPQELVTYGGNGQVFSNWIQFRVTLWLLARMDRRQTLAIYSGHPMGLFPSHADAPRVVITNGMMIPNYSSRELYDKLFALGVTMYGQMTAGSYCYIGPQGIVHGTTITLMSALHKYLGVKRGTDSFESSAGGKVFVSSGLGGMSGAQPKAAVIAGCIGVIAEINRDALVKRHAQGWLNIWSAELDQIVHWIKEYKAAKQSISIGYLGNVVHLWERLVQEPELLAELGSDQTSCHNPLNGGYYPVGLTFEEAHRLMAEDKPKFAQLVRQSLVRHISAIRTLSERGMHFWDYGNAFLLECQRAGADILRADARDDKSFIFPSYMQDIMGDIFSLGFGPFRWVCTSGEHADLERTDKMAIAAMEGLLAEGDVSEGTREQYENNLAWVRNAEGHQLVVGSEARILYSDLRGRLRIAQSFNEAVREGKLKGPVVISRDHHDVSGTDSPFRETSNIDDGSAYTADMAIQNVIGDSFRGATWVAIHNGGGVGWGDAINGGFGLLLDGTEEADRRLALMLRWDVANGVARRCWAGNGNARAAIGHAMRWEPGLSVTLPSEVDEQALARLVPN